MDGVPGCILMSEQVADIQLLRLTNQVADVAQRPSEHRCSQGDHQRTGEIMRERLGQPR